MALKMAPAGCRSPVSSGGAGAEDVVSRRGVPLELEAGPDTGEAGGSGASGSRVPNDSPREARTSPPAAAASASRCVMTEAGNPLGIGHDRPLRESAPVFRQAATGPGGLKASPAGGVDAAAESPLQLLEFAADLVTEFIPQFVPDSALDLALELAILPIDLRLPAFPPHLPPPSFAVVRHQDVLDDDGPQPDHSDPDDDGDSGPLGYRSSPPAKPPCCGPLHSLALAA